MAGWSRVVLAAAAGVVCLVVPSSPVSSEPPPATFHGLTPARLVDTRPNGETIDGLAKAQGPIAGGQTLSFPVVGRGGVPATGVGSVALNVTAINPTEPSFLTVYPAGADRPNASNLNLAPGRTLPNMVIVPLGAAGEVSIYNDQGLSNVAVDVLGWFPPAQTFQGLTPARLADTRPNGQTVDGQAKGEGALAGGTTLTVPIAGRGGVPATGAGAVALNVTAINPTAPSFLTVYPAGADRPHASNLNLDTGRTLPNMVVVRLGSGGQVDLYNDQGATNVAVDVLGWFPDSDNFTGLTPARLADTRPNGQTVDGLSRATGPVAGGALLNVPMLGRGGLPLSGVGAVALNVTAVNPTAASFLTVYPAGSTRPNASNLNLAPGRTLPNMVIVPLGAAGNVSIYNDQGATHVAVDVLGWFPTTMPFSTTRVSVAAGGTQATGGISILPSISADGRYVAFSSSATNLVTGDTNSLYDVFVHDRMTGATSRVSVATDGTQAAGGDSFAPSISADGRYVAFESFATNLVTGDTNGFRDVFVHDRMTGATSRVSVATGGTQAAGGDSMSASISADGGYVAFESFATDLVAGDTNGLYDVFVHDRMTGATTRVSVATGGTQAAGGSSINASISADGRYVAFESYATNLVTGDTNGFDDVFVHDRTTGATTRVSVATGGAQATGGNSSRPSISADGRYVAFQSAATNLVLGDTNGFFDIFVHDRTTGGTTRVSVATGGAQATGGNSSAPRISADGRDVTFQSAATNLVAGDTNNATDVFVHNHTN